MDSLELYPQYVSSAFRTQARTIANKNSKADCKLACLLEIVSSFIRKYGNSCWASTSKLVKDYNLAAPRYGLRQAKESTIYHQLDLLEQGGYITRTRYFIKETGQPRRYVDLNLDRIASKFESVINWAVYTASKRLAREKPNSCPPYDENGPKASCDKASELGGQKQDPSIRSNKTSKDVNKNKTGVPDDRFFMRFFGDDANTMKDIQTAFRHRRLSASGAKLFISLAGKHGFDLHRKVRAALNGIIWSATQTKKATPAKGKGQLVTKKRWETHELNAMSKKELLALGIERIEMPRVNGVVQFAYQRLVKQGVTNE